MARVASVDIDTEQHSTDNTVPSTVPYVLCVSAASNMASGWRHGGASTCCQQVLRRHFGLGQASKNMRSSLAKAYRTFRTPQAWSLNWPLLSREYSSVSFFLQQ